MKRRFVVACAAMAVLFVAQVARGEVIANVSTGLDASNDLINVNGQSDAHWTVDQIAGGTAAAQAVMSSGADFFHGGGGNPAWLDNGPNSDWIARNANTSANGAAPYTFYCTFDLTGYDLTTASIAGLWAIDDSGDVSLNGNLLLSLPGENGQNWGAFHSFSVSAGSPYFNQGLNTLTITMTTSDNAWEAARLEGTVTGNAIPEPATAALLAAVLVGFCVGAWRKRK